jgi:hypothetical protein
MFETTQVFQRSLGGDSDVVMKEMYTFDDKGGNSLTLRPEGTAGMCPSMICVRCGVCAVVCVCVCACVRARAHSGMQAWYVRS